jgi:uncharacterized protein YdaU (DUF1376 family)
MTEHLLFQKMFWPDFFAKTQCLPGFAEAIYGMLIGRLWIAGGALPDNDRRIAEMLKINLATWRRLKPQLAPFLQMGDGWIRQKRVTEDILHAHEEIKKRAERTRFAREAQAKNRKNKGLGGKKGSVTDAVTHASYSQSVNSGLRPESLHAATDVAAGGSSGSPGLGGRSPFEAAKNAVPEDDPLTSAAEFERRFGAQIAAAKARRQG